MRSMLILAVFAALLSACSSNSAKIEKSWVAEDALERNLSGVLVVAIASKEQGRKRFEDEFTERLVAKGARAVASHTLKRGVKISKEDVADMAAQAKVDTVMVTTFAGRDSTEVLHPGRRYYAYRPVYGGGYYGRGVYGVPWEVGRTSDFWSEHKSLHLEASIYEVSNSELLWRASAGITDTNDVDSMLKSFIAAFIDELHDDKLLK